MNQLNPEAVNQIQENVIAYFRIFAGLPGITFVEDAEMIWNVGGPGAFILRTRLPANVAEQRIDEIIGKIGQSIAQSADVIDWFVFPSCQPADLGERVAARGLAGEPHGEWTLIGKIGGPGGDWLLADLPSLSQPPRVAEPFHVVPVENEQMLETWRQATSAGFGGSDYQPFYAAYARHGFAADAISLHYIGYRGDQPVTSGTLLLAGGIPGLFGISTPPAFRRQGFGSAISWAMLQEMQKRGYMHAYVWSSPMGKTVYRGVGFVPIALGIREYSW